MTSILTRKDDTITISNAPDTEIFVTVGDLSSGFAFTDTNNLISSYSYNSGTSVHSFGLVGVNPAVGNYALNSTPNFTGPRWTQPLVDGNGDPVLAGDSFALLTKFRSLSLGTTQGWAIFLGAASDDSSTILTTMKPIGSWAGSTSAGIPNGGVQNINNATTLSLAGAASISSSTQFSGAPGKTTSGQLSIIGASSSPVTNRLGISALSISDSTQLTLAICPTTVSAVIAVAGTLEVEISYAIVRY
jgi:hypothetical protein